MKAKTPKPVDLRKLKAGDEDKVVYRNTGYGLTTYERVRGIIGVKKGALYTSSFDRGDGMTWNGVTWVFDCGLGLATSIARIEDIPPAEARQLRD